MCATSPTLTNCFDIHWIPSFFKSRLHPTLCALCCRNLKLTVSFLCPLSLLGLNFCRPAPHSASPCASSPCCFLVWCCFSPGACHVPPHHRCRRCRNLQLLTPPGKTDRIRKIAGNPTEKRPKSGKLSKPKRNEKLSRYQVDMDLKKVVDEAAYKADRPAVRKAVKAVFEERYLNQPPRSDKSKKATGIKYFYDKLRF
ncbi:unnamed protein product [Phaeothamnion confervicola]